MGTSTSDKEQFSLAELTHDTLQKFELAAEGRRQERVADIPPEPPFVEADLGMIERALTNLLDNAIRHTPVGCRIEVRFRREQGGVEAQVSDTEPRVLHEVQKYLFR